MHRGEEGEFLEVVNDCNEVIDLLPRAEVHRRGLQHRSAHIFVFNREDELYLQKRSFRKSELPGFYDSSAAGHLLPSESYEACALRELTEELSLSEDLVLIGGLLASDENAFEHVRLFACRTEKKPIPNLDEIEEGGFYSMEHIQRWIHSGAEGLSPGFVILFGRHQSQIRSFLRST